jgi:hypothetical protein
VNEDRNREILALYRGGEKMASIASRFALSLTSISQILAKESVREANCSRYRQVLSEKPAALDTKVDDLIFPLRDSSIKYMLKCENILTIKDLIDYRRDELQRFGNLGKGSLAAIEIVLRELGHELRSISASSLHQVADRMAAAIEAALPVIVDMFAAFPYAEQAGDDEVFNELRAAARAYREAK